MDGIETTKTIRERERASVAHTPIIAMTACVMPSDRERCFQVGMDGYLTKPVRFEELFRVMHGVAVEMARGPITG